MEKFNYNPFESFLDMQERIKNMTCLVAFIGKEKAVIGADSAKTTMNFANSAYELGYDDKIICAKGVMIAHYGQSSFDENNNTISVYSYLSKEIENNNPIELVKSFCENHPSVLNYGFYIIIKEDTGFSLHHIFRQRTRFDFEQKVFHEKTTEQDKYLLTGYIKELNDKTIEKLNADPFDTTNEIIELNVTIDSYVSNKPTMVEPAKVAVMDDTGTVIETFYPEHSQ